MTAWEWHELAAGAVNVGLIVLVTLIITALVLRFIGRL